MKKLMSLVVITLLCMGNAFAQKKGVCVEEFSYNSQIGTNWVTNLRNNIIAGIMETDRVNLIDQATFGELPKDDQARYKAMYEKGVDYILKGHFNTLNVMKKTDKEGNVSYECTANYTLTVVDGADGTIKTTETFDNTWYTGDSESDAITNALGKAVKEMGGFVDNNFKMTALVKAIDSYGKKNEAKTVYISIGSDQGVQEGQAFDVFVSLDIAGEKIQKNIGSLLAKEVVSGKMTLCKVNKGGQDISKYFAEGNEMSVQSKEDKNFFRGLVKDAKEIVE